MIPRDPQNPQEPRLHSRGPNWTLEQWEAYRDHQIAACARLAGHGKWVERIGRPLVSHAERMIARLREASGA